MTGGSRHIRNVVKKMHGLQIRQGAEYAPLFWRSLASGSSAQATFNAYGVDDPVTLNYFLMYGESYDNREYYVKRMYDVHTLTNHTPAPCYVEIIYLMARASMPLNGSYTDLATTVYVSMSQDVEGATDYPLVPYLSPLVSPFFRKNFKIVKRKVRLLQPGIPRNFKLQCSKAILNKPIMKSVEGDNANWVIRKGNRIMAIRVYGCPAPAIINTSSFQNETTLTSFTVSHMRRRYASWYNMDEARDRTYLREVPPEFTGLRPAEAVVLTPSNKAQQMLHTNTTGYDYRLAQPQMTALTNVAQGSTAHGGGFVRGENNAHQVHVVP